MVNLFDPPGTPFGTAHNEERDRIRRHLRRRIWKFGLDGRAALRLEARVDAIQRRLHRYDETFAVRSRRWSEQQRAKHPPRPTLDLTEEQLERLVEHFVGANDPVTAEIGAKAQAALDNRQG